MLRDFRAVPLSGLRSGSGHVSVSALTVLDAMEQARQSLGETTPFDLLEGECFVLAYRPARRWRTVLEHVSSR